MNKLRKVITYLVIFTIVFSSFNITSYAKQTERTSDDIKQLIAYYKNYQESATTDIERLLSEMKKNDIEQGKAWENIMNYWSEVNSENFTHVDNIQEGLPEDDSMAIVILGFALNEDGTMKDELIGRLSVGLEMANKYPNSYVVVTGGGTAANNPNVTEGGVMGEWLLEHGLSEKRLIIENRAPDTVGNARYTYKILKEKYPQVNTISLVTSDYHVPRGCLLYYSTFVLDALKNGSEPLTIISNLGYKTGSKGYESIELQANGLCSVAGISSSSLPKVKLSELESLTVTQEDIHKIGEDLKLNVVANYDSGYTRDVTQIANISGFDKYLDENQTINIAYEENGVLINGSFTLNELHKEIIDYRSKIQKLMDKVEGMDSYLYTSKTTEILDFVYDKVETILNKTDVEDKELKQAYNALNKAIQQLETRENIALHKNVKASHNDENAYKITDGSNSTYWESFQNGNIPINQSEFIVDLNGIYQLDAINVIPYFKGNNRKYHYDVYVSENNTTWDKIAEYRGNEYTTDKGQIFKFNNKKEVRYIKVVGKYVKVEGREDINNFHVCELMAYGDLIRESEDHKIPVENLALYGEVTANGNKLDVITDGDKSNSYWTSSEEVENAEAIIELTGDVNIKKITVVPYYNNPSIWYTYDILVSNDKKTWTKVGSCEQKQNTGKTGYTLNLENDITGRYVKIAGIATNNTNNHHLHLVEVEVFGSLENIALNKNTEANYVRGESYVSNNVTDGNLSTIWDTGDVVDKVSDWNNLSFEKRPWIVIDLKDIYELDTINVLTYRKSDRYYKYEVYTSLNGNDYTLVGKKDDDFKAHFSKTFDVNKGQKAMYIKIVGLETSNNPGFHISEVRASGVYVPEELADYSKVEETIAKVPTNLDLYTIDSVVDLKIALSQVKEGLTISSQTDVDLMAEAVEKAIHELVYKDADYSKVDEAIVEAKALNKDNYKDFSKVQNAIDAVVRGKNITEQKEVDAMAEAIKKAISELEEKELVNKEELKEAIACKPEKEEAAYTSDSWKVYEEALTKAIEVEKNENALQEEIDAAKDALIAAMKALKENPDWTPLEPSKPVIPWTPLEPSKLVIPWTQLESSKPVIPMENLKPAKPMEIEKPSTDDKEKTPETGVSTNAKILWIALLSASALMIVFANKKKKVSNSL